MKIRHNNGFALVLSIVIGVFLSILLSAALFRVQNQFQESNQKLQSQQAFYAADSGIQRAVYELRRNPLFRPGFNGQPLIVNVPLRYSASDSSIVGFYSIEVKPTANYNAFQSVYVKAIGRDARQQIAKAIRVRVIVDSPTSFFISTAGDLRIGSGSTFQNDFLGKDVYFDVNTSLPTPQRDININGRIYYLNQVYGANHPDVHLSPSSQTIHFPSLTFAGVDIEHYRSVAQQHSGRYESGNFTYSNQVISTANLNAPNGVVFAEGDIHISGTISDSMLFVAGGNIYIDNNITPISSTITPQLGLLAKRNVFIDSAAPNDLTINAFVMADGANSAEGGIFKALGTRLSKGTLTFNGAMALRGANNARTAADLNVYRQRNYSYNNQLRDNPQIPLLPYFANVVRWDEIDPDEPLP